MRLFFQESSPVIIPLVPLRGPGGELFILPLPPSSPSRAHQVSCFHIGRSDGGQPHVSFPSGARKQRVAIANMSNCCVRSEQLDAALGENDDALTWEDRNTIATFMYAGDGHASFIPSGERYRDFVLSENGERTLVFRIFPSGRWRRIRVPRTNE